jgi:hypothetical protein
MPPPHNTDAKSRRRPAKFYAFHRKFLLPGHRTPLYENAIFDEYFIEIMGCSPPPDCHNISIHAFLFEFLSLHSRLTISWAFIRDFLYFDTTFRAAMATIIQHSFALYFTTFIDFYFASFTARSRHFSSLAISNLSFRNGQVSMPVNVISSQHRRHHYWLHLPA